MSQVALITEVFSGWGKEYAKLFAADGHGVALVARGRALLQELAIELANTHDVSTHVVAPNLNAPRQIFEDVKQAGLEVGFLVNSAKFGSTGSFVEWPLEREVSMIQVDIAALVHLTGLSLPRSSTEGRDGSLGPVPNIFTTGFSRT